MDLDWCLSCDRRIESGSSPYCSPECLSYAQPSTSSRPQQCPCTLASRDNSPTQHNAGILNWAHAIPSNSPAGAPHRPFTYPSPPHPSHPSNLNVHRPPSPPRLLKRTPPVRPTLGMSSNSHPHTHTTHSHAPRSIATPPPPSVGASTSLSSLLTDSPPATPSDVPFHHPQHHPPTNVLCSLASHVKSWVATPLPPSSRPHLSDSHHHHRDHEKDGSSVGADRGRHVVFPSCRTGEDDLDLWDVDNHNSKEYWVGEHSLQPVSRGRDLRSGLSAIRDDHPAYRARGRRSSRAIV